MVTEVSMELGSGVLESYKNIWNPYHTHEVVQGTEMVRS